MTQALGVFEFPSYLSVFCVGGSGVTFAMTATVLLTAGTDAALEVAVEVALLGKARRLELLS